jgi:cytochrome b involved in lipid metabolism
MLSQTQHASISRLWNLGKETPIFYLLLSKSAAQQTKHHLAVYSKKGLVSTIHGVDNLSKHLQIPTPVLEKTIQDYQLEASQGIDKYGKTMFENVPVVDLNTETFVVGAVGPALHYCMGGITIDTEGNVMKENGTLVEGLHGAGEVTGGVHGENRLGGNSLLECAVFGSIVGKKIPVDDSRERTSHKTAKKSKPNKPKEPLQQFSMEEIAEHTLPKDCWVALHGRVYDLSDFIEQHPGGLSSILSLAGTDGTKFFDGVHSSQILERLSRHVVGVLRTHPTETKNTALKVITQKELKNHASNSDVWVAIHGVVYDLTEFSQIHPGGSYLIQKLAGKDGTEEFQVFHEAQKLEMIQKHALGRLQDTAGMNTFLQTMK